jgi:hypothetical protein
VAGIVVLFLFVQLMSKEELQVKSALGGGLVERELVVLGAHCPPDVYLPVGVNPPPVAVNPPPMGVDPPLRCLIPYGCGFFRSWILVGAYDPRGRRCDDNKFVSTGRRSASLLLLLRDPAWRCHINVTREVRDTKD